MQWILGQNSGCGNLYRPIFKKQKARSPTSHENPTVQHKPCWSSEYDCAVTTFTVEMWKNNGHMPTRTINNSPVKIIEKHIFLLYFNKLYMSTNIYKFNFLCVLYYFGEFSTNFQCPFRPFIPLKSLNSF